VLYFNIFKDFSDEEILVFEGSLDKIRENIKEMDAVNKEKQYD